MQHPELVEHVDFMAVHMLPYWEGVDVDQAVHYIAARMHDLEKTFPGKPIIIAEVGWPSYGRARHAAVASTSNEAMFLRRFLAYAAAQQWTYYVDGSLRPALEAADRGRGGCLLGRVERVPPAEIHFHPAHREHPDTGRCWRPSL